MDKGVLGTPRILSVSVCRHASTKRKSGRWQALQIKTSEVTKGDPKRQLDPLTQPGREGEGLINRSRSSEPEKGAATNGIGGAQLFGEGSWSVNEIGSLEQSVFVAPAGCTKTEELSYRACETKIVGSWVFWDLLGFRSSGSLPASHTLVWGPFMQSGMPRIGMD